MPVSISTTTHNNGKFNRMKRSIFRHNFSFFEQKREDDKYIANIKEEEHNSRKKRCVQTFLTNKEYVRDILAQNRVNEILGRPPIQIEETED